MRSIDVDYHQSFGRGIAVIWTVGLVGEREYLDPPQVGEIVELRDADSPLRCLARTRLVRPADHSHATPPCPYMEFEVDPTSWHPHIGTARCEHLSIGPVTWAACPLCGELEIVA